MKRMVRIKRNSRWWRKDSMKMVENRRYEGQVNGGEVGIYMVIMESRTWGY